MSVYPSHIWIGTFTDDAPEDYFSDEAEREDDDAPMNLFAKEQGEHYFDYDFTEISYVDWKDAVDPRSFVDRHSYSDSYIEKIVQLAAERGMPKINVFVLASIEQFEAPRSVSSDTYRLEYLGVFYCTG